MAWPYLPMAWPYLPMAWPHLPAVIQFYDTMNMVWHDDIFIKDNMRKMIWDDLPKYFGNFTNRRIFHFTFHNFSKKPLPVSCTYCNIMRKFAPVIKIPQSDIFAFVAHNSEITNKILTKNNFSETSEKLMSLYTNL